MAPSGAAVSQNFTTYIGDAAVPIFNVVDRNGNPVDISAASDIIWSAFRTWGAAPVLQKRKTAGQITFVTDGTNGQFQLQLAAPDTNPLSGNYLHKSQLEDVAGNLTTIATGTMYVGPAPAWTYDPTQLTTSPLMQIRVQIGDTQYNDQSLYDEEINFCFAQRPNLYGACAEACRLIASKNYRRVDVVQGLLKTNYSQIAKSYDAKARQFDFLASTRGPGLPYAGGISAADKEQQVENDDRVTPAFNIGMDDNYLPIAPAGNVIPGSDPGQASDGGGGP